MKRVNIYYYVYNMFMEALSENDIEKGLNKALDIVTSLAFGTETYVFKYKDNSYKDFLDQNSRGEGLITSSILNNISDRVLSHDYYVINPYINKVSSILYIPIDESHVLAILNHKKDDFIKYISIIRECLKVLLERFEAYEEIRRMGSVDTLTGLNNRNSYEEMIRKLDKSNLPFIFAIFDLFRLKYLNDTYSHYLGDQYIIGAAEVLKKYYYCDIQKLFKPTEIGTKLYRIGGDEFVLITDFDSIDAVKVKARLATMDVEALKLEGDAPLGLNYGIVEKESNEKVKELYISADQRLIDDKNKMYRRLGIARR